jgi:hypothetical protein
MKGSGFIFIISFLLLHCSCKREESAGPLPVIEIIEPYGNLSFGYGDTMMVRANISHEEPIDYVRVAIVNEESSPVLPVQMFYPEGNVFKLETVFVFDNLLTETGKLSVNVRAGSAKGLSNEWTDVNYTSTPRTFESLLVVTNHQLYVHSVSEIFVTGQVSERFSVSGDYSGSAVSSKHQKFYKAGSILNAMDAWDLRLNQISWSVPAVSSPPLPYFTAIYSDNKEVFCATRESQVSAYSALGINTFRSKQFSNGYFTSLIRYKSWVVAVFEPFNSSINKLVVFNYPGGTVFREINFTGKVISVNDFGYDGLLLFVNENAQSAVYNYNFDLNALVKLKEFPQGNINKVAMPDVRDAFLAFADGVYWYRPAIASVVKINHTGNASDLAYEPISGRLFVAAGYEVILYISPDFQSVMTYIFNDPLVHIHLLYNK